MGFLEPRRTDILRVGSAYPHWGQHVFGRTKALVKPSRHVDDLSRETFRSMPQARDHAPRMPTEQFAFMPAC